jgi:hypothetical protein
MRPTFIVIGAMKAGTTSLAAYLRLHREVFMTTPKEPQFFASPRWEQEGLDWYERLFAPAGSARARGEASTTYTMAPHIPHVPERIAATVPDVRLVYLIRNPIDRIRSQYVHHADALGERRPLATMLHEEPAFLDFSRYGMQIDGYLEHFARERMLVVSSEALRREPQSVLERVYRFIGVDPDHRADIGVERNRGVEKRRVWRAVRGPRALLHRSRALRQLPMSAKQRLRRVVSSPINVAVPADLEAEIWAELAPDLARLRAIVGDDFDLWGRA